MVVGVVAAVVLASVRRAASRVSQRGSQRLSMPVFLLAGGLAVGVTALVADGLGAPSLDVLFSGQSAIPDLIAEDSTKIVLLLLLAEGGRLRDQPRERRPLPVMWFDTSPTVAIAIGAAAGMAAQTRLLLTSILFGALLVGTKGLDATPAAVLAAAAAWMTASVLDARRGDARA